MGAAPTREDDGTEDPGYGWQGELIDLPAYLKRIGHVLEPEDASRLIEFVRRRGR